jgi:hypothetical protein
MNVTLPMMSYMITLEYYNKSMAPAINRPILTRGATCSQTTHPDGDYYITTSFAPDDIYRHWNNLNDDYGLVISCTAPPNSFNVVRSYHVSAETLRAIYERLKIGEETHQQLRCDAGPELSGDITMAMTLRRMTDGLFISAVHIYVNYNAIDRWFRRYKTYQRQMCSTYWATH